MRRWTERAVPWTGGLFIAVIVALAGCDIVESYRGAVANTGRELDAQARIIAEQTARSVQAVDVLLRHLAQQHRQGTLPALESPRLREYLHEQAVGLSQIDGLVLVDAGGNVRTTSYAAPEVESTLNVAGQEPFDTLRGERQTRLVIDNARQSTVDGGWMFRMARRIDSASGEFAGAVGARGRIDYYERFYRNVQLGEGTTVVLMHQNGTLLARHPPAEGALGKHFPLFDQLMTPSSAAVPGPRRTVSPIDGVERFSSLKLVADYPLAVIVTRDAAAALAPWSARSLGTALRTLALSALAGLLLYIAARQLARLRRARESLEVSQERFGLAVAGSNQGLWDWDLATDTMFVSARAQEFMGLEPGEPMRPRREWIALSAYHPDDVDAVRGAISDHLQGRSTFYAVDYRLRHPSGEWHWYRQRGVALRGAEGRPYRMAGSMEDITAQKDLEGQLLQAKKLEAIGTLAGGIAHDFNNILAAILGYGEMAQKSAAAGTPLRRHVDAVVSAGLRAKSLVERILAFSRSGIGGRKPVQVQSVVGEALDLVAASLPSHVRLERALDAGEAAVMGDATQIHQVVMNLCANGAQAMRAQGTLAVTLDVVDRAGFRAATSTLAAGRYVRLAVRDTGSGIPAQIFERIFDPFFTTKDVGVGTGLGLSLVHGIVTDLGGGIEVDSRPGAGATFTVYLPASGAAAAAPAAADEALPEGSGETVLIVDDEEPLVRLGEEMIAGLGYEPVGFASSAAALESFRAAPGRFHAVLTDESMPELTGSDLAREIRKLRPAIPIVMMSGVVTPALAARARELGGVEVLAKPLAERDLARSLAAALNSQGRTA